MTLNKTEQSDRVTLRILVEAQSPLLLGSGFSGNNGNLRTSRNLIPGSVWRGAVARTILENLGIRKEHGQPPVNTTPPEFEVIFGGTSPARFGFLYPIRRPAKEAMTYKTLPVPLTARQCKQQPGFHGTGHGVYDGLRNRLAHSIDSQLNHTGLGSCPMVECQGRLERIRGFASYQTYTTSPSYQQEKVGTRSFVRVGLNRYTETAQDQILYVQEALVPDTDAENNLRPLTFVGSWYGTPSQAEVFRQLLDEHLLPVEKDVYHLRIGSARARGMGATYLHLAQDNPSTETDPRQALEGRLMQFQPRRQDGTRLKDTHLYASLTLRSPLQLLDVHGIPTTQIDAYILRDYCTQVPDSLKVLNNCTVLEQESWSGWSGAWGMPKPVTSAVSASSVLMVKAKESEKEELLDFLTEIERNGLGEQRQMGWGEITVCDQFHMEHDEQEKTSERS